MADPKKILVVDDEPEITSVLDEYFSARGYTVLTAKNGRDALELVDRERPAIVLLDIRMPGMDGIKVLQQIKLRSPEVAVIMISALKDPVLANRALALGARDYITKPFDLAYLERSVRTQLIGQPSRAEATPPVAPPAAEMDPALALAEFLGQTTVPVTSTPDIAEELAAPSSRPEAKPAVALATECFRLAAGLTPPRLARGIEECALWLLEAVADGGQRQPHVNTLRLHLDVAQRLGSLTVDELARLDALCRDLEE